jgi:hypothetical protein
MAEEIIRSGTGILGNELWACLMVLAVFGGVWLFCALMLAWHP